MHVHGIDIIEISRIRQSVKTWGIRFTNRVYTENEMELCQGQVHELATRFAGKEAVMKALGTGTRGVGWKDIEILRNQLGTPVVNLYGRAESLAGELAIYDLCISLSHSRVYAIASVIGEQHESGNS